MPKQPSLEQTTKLAKLLSPEDRKQLFNFLAALPDSGIASGSIDPPSPLLSPEDKSKVEEAASTDQPIVVYTETYAAVFLKGRAMVSLFFYPQNFQQSRREISSWRDAPPRENIINQIREIFRLHGQPEPSEENIIAAAKQAQNEVFEADTFRTTKEFAARLGHMTWLLYDGGLKVVELGWRNQFARQTGQPTKPLSEIVKELEPYWKAIKQHLDLQPGGRQNVKHQWSPRDHTCLAIHYDRLKPIWRGAKKAAKQALESKEASRRKSWRDQVSAAYKDEKLPDDLIEQLAPSINSQPADLALVHAARLCLPVSYSTKVLKQKLREFNSLGSSSSKIRKNK